ncbi:MAG TPA: multicopper oxidase domain-containing protein [Gemmatimonadales bacterium]|nr:multicopper oxidase domain-containing protein [Gemmatimonadales bacterium]
MLLLPLAVHGASIDATHPRDRSRMERVVANDNIRPAGTLRGRELRLRLDARVGMWRPDGEGEDAAGAAVPAFSEAGKPLQIPGPLVRVPVGTEIVMMVKNSLPGTVLTMHGLVSRLRPPGSTPDSVAIASGASREVRFRLDAPGTYYYWGTTTGRDFRLRTGKDAQLSGAIVVDEPGAPRRRDRILVIGMWSDTTPSETTRDADQARLLLVVNGRSWPHTSRLTYTVGDSVRWRVINASADVHPMHLHGFYYHVDSRGDGMVDSTYADARRDMVVTERLSPGRTMTMSWVPERPGNWLFHCHFTSHFAARGPLGLTLDQGGARAGARHAENHALQGMNGLVIGVHVAPGRSAAGRRAAESDVGRRRIRLLVRGGAGGSEALPLYDFVVQEGDSERAADSLHRMGPPIVLTRDVPVSITVVNSTPEPTAIHWHGIELESYFDGVAGFSGNASRVSPIIAPADSFEARFTPPRAGTFIYHTHIDELRQEPAGMAGPLIVIDPDHPYDPRTDIPVLISSPRDPADESKAVLLNGSLTPRSLEMRAGVSHRLRFINITIARPNMRMELRQATTVLTWTQVAKDGAELPAERRAVRPARQPISIGETIDVEITPAAGGALRLEARTGTGVLLGVLPVRVTEAGPARSP